MAMSPERFDKLDTCDDKFRVIYQAVFELGIDRKKYDKQFKKVWISIGGLGVLGTGGAWKLGVLNSELVIKFIDIVL
jgi:hypothetical protein